MARELEKINKILVWFSVLFCVGLMVAPVGARAAILYLKPSSEEYQIDDIFIVEVLLDTQGEYINTAKVDLTFSQDTLEIKDFSKGNSILTLWVEEPSFLNQSGIISFAGGIPGGYQGKDGLLGKIIFGTKKQGKGEIWFGENSQVLLNDGWGTSADLKSEKANFNILVAGLEKAQNQWQQVLKQDNIPPESFKIEIHQDPGVFGGKYFISFSTTDKQTGVDYYEIKEGKKEWQRAESPYLLEDQNLQSIIKVKAVDKAGNERIEEYIPELPSKTFVYWIIIAIIFISFVTVIVWWYLKSKIKGQKSK